MRELVKTYDDISKDLGDIISDIGDEVTGGVYVKIRGNIEKITVAENSVRSYSNGILVIISDGKRRSLEININDYTLDVRFKNIIFVNFNINDYKIRTLILSCILCNISPSNKFQPLQFISKSVLRIKGEGRRSISSTIFLDSVIMYHETISCLAVGCVLFTRGDSGYGVGTVINSIVFCDGVEFSAGSFINSLVHYEFTRIVNNNIVYSPVIPLYSIIMGRYNFQDDKNIFSINANKYVVSYPEMKPSFVNNRNDETVDIAPASQYIKDAFTGGVPIYKGVICGVINDYPDEKDVLKSVSYGGGMYEGKLVLPPPNKVIKNTYYGPYFWGYAMVGQFDYEKYKEEIGIKIETPEIER